MSNNDFNPISNIFIYFMILFSFFLIGGLFLLINSPLLIDLLNEKTYPDFNHAFISTIQKWKEFLNMDFNGEFLIIYSSLALIMGYIIKGVSYFFMFIPVKIEKIISRLKLFKRFRIKKSFNPSNYFESSFLNAILFSNRSESNRLHWEWENFNYYLQWGIFTNFLIWAILLYFLIKPPNFPFFYISLFILFLLGLGCIRSIVLQAFYDNYQN